MDAYLAIFKTSFRNSFVYRSSVFVSIFGSVFAVFVQIAIWNIIFREKPATIQYMTIYVIISRLLQIFYTDNICGNIGQKVRDGNFVTDLLKPIQPIFSFWSSSFGANIATFLTQGLPILIMFFPALLNLDFDVTKLLIFIGICIMNLCLTSFIYILLGYLAFVVIEVWPFQLILNEIIKLLSGALIPIAFFPLWLENAVKFTPFYLLYSFPLRFLLEKLPPNEIYSNLIILLFWMLFFSVILMIIHRIALRRCVVQGG
ncbi:MAG: ABC-2 family transporter protein [Firmicutes bacterium]|nr:ABC-2 family transporter protein [Bacillota bacterium]